jgi:hypothetical protein
VPKLVSSNRTSPACHCPGENEWSTNCIRLNFNIPGESLESNSVFLFNGNRDMARLACLDVVHGSGFTGVRAPNDTTKGSVF